MKSLVSYLIGFVVFAGGLNAHAQSLDGCVVGRTPIPSIRTANIPDIAMAGFTPQGMPAIFINPALGAITSPRFSEWVYWHECAHHLLGHALAGTVGLSRPYVDEQEADCWGIRHMVEQGLTNEGVSAIQVEASHALGQAGDRSHLPAFVRALNLRACLASREEHCRTVTASRTEIRTRTVMTTRIIPCRDIICGYAGCFAAHPNGDLVNVPVQEPYTVEVPVTTQDCSNSDADEEPIQPQANHRWQYEYSRVDKDDDWHKSMKFYSEEACQESQQRRNDSPRYMTLECEEVEDD